MRILCVVPYPPDRAPGQRYRLEQWLQLLPPGSLEFELHPLLDEATYARLYEPGRWAAKIGGALSGLVRRLHDVVDAKAWDAAYLYREAFPLGLPVLEGLLQRRVPVVYDFDDAIFLGDTSPANRVIGRFKRPDKVATVIGRSAVTTVGNAWLASYARQFASDVRVIPTTVDTDRYVPVPGTDKGTVRVGWSGSPTTSPHLRIVAGALEKISREPGVDLYFVGDPDLRLPGVPVQVRRWDSGREIADLASMDIGIMPLPDDPWSRGKCGLKALLYMAMGLPTIVSPVGVATEIVEDGVNGLVATTEDEWLDALQALVADADLRRRLGEAARRTVLERYSGAQWAPHFLRALSDAVGSGRGA